MLSHSLTGEKRNHSYLMLHNTLRKIKTTDYDLISLYTKLSLQLD